jgi:hypothetical protein
MNDPSAVGVARRNDEKAADGFFAVVAFAVVVDVRLHRRPRPRRRGLSAAFVALPEVQ